jgi:phosphoribosylformimino-5-aminoimidazole carboxamide ribotide isomerase|tara:strand:- start:3846 stop:4664 length:819 start_codon:yes stop_codon:yes gene_type:complete
MRVGLGFGGRSHLNKAVSKTKFRPCIDLHEGKVKQIVGGTLNDEGATENFVSEKSPYWYAKKFRDDFLLGGHVIQLGPGNQDAAREALAAWPGGLQIGGGIGLENAREWIAAGAGQVIVTSWLFDKEGRFLKERLVKLAEEVGKERVVVDLSCRKVVGGWKVAMNRWQTITEMPITLSVIEELSDYCGEFLIHAADVEGICGGVDEGLVALLGKWRGCPITYAGGVRGLDDLQLINEASGGRLDATVGSALDLFGGSGVTYEELIQWNQNYE